MTSRREFLGAGVAVGLSACASGPLSRKREIVDAQVHLWKASSPELPWVPGAKPQMPEPFTIEKCVALMDEAAVDRVVIVPPALTGARNDYALEAVRRYPGRFAVMGRIAQNDPKAAVLFPKWKEQPGMLGIRVTFLGPSAAWLRDGTADWIWPAAEKAGLPVMFLTAANSAYFARVAERHPGLTLIADHMGLAGEVTADRREDAFQQALALAKYPNASVKLSAIGRISAEDYPFRDSASYIRRLYDAFGPRRCYWGTDITNSFAKATWRQRVTQFTEELPFLSEEDKDWILGRAIRARLGWS